MWTVRTDAWVALMSDAGNEAIAAFLASGLADAIARASETGAMNRDFVVRVLDAYPAKFAPEVHAAAERALAGTDSERDLFVREGFAAAEQRDRRAREADGSQARALVEADRKFVRNLSLADPGAQVRAAAAWALRPGSGDEDLVEFFSYGWAHAALLDLEVSRLRGVEEQARWRVAARRLAADADAAERAALATSGAAAREARATAVKAWRAAADGTAAPKASLVEAQQVAQREADNWHAIAAAAASASGPNWQAMAGPAARTEAEWAADRQQASEQLQFWDSLLRQALEGESRMSV